MTMVRELIGSEVAEVLPLVWLRVVPSQDTNLGLMPSDNVTTQFEPLPGWAILMCCEDALEGSRKQGHPRKTSVKKLNMKVHINATGDTLVMKFLRPNPNTKLEGFVLGYGSNFFSNQYIQWPENGKSYVTEVDAEPRYLVAVKPNESNKKSCKDKSSAKKPLQLVVGTLTPSSVFLSWGILINPQVDWSVLNKCPNDRFYTVRYREKNKDWLFQLCPTTEIVIDNLKPNTMYEFGVKDNTEDGIWSNSYSHKTIPKGKDNGHVQSTYKNHKSIIQMPGDNTKAFIPITVIKQGIQNLSNLIQPKSTAAPPPTEHTPVHKEETKKPFTTTTKPRTPKPKPVFKFTEPPPVAKTEKPDVEYPEAAPKERSLFETKPLLSTPVPQYEHGSTEPIPEIIKTDASHTTEQEKIHLASSDKTSAQTYTAAHKPVTETTAAPKERSLLETKPLLSTAVPQYEHGSTEPIPEIIKTDASHTTEQEKIHLAFWTTPQSLEPSTRTTSIRTTLAPKKSRRLPTKTKTTPTPEAKPPTPVLKVTKPVDTVEESSYPLVPDEAQKSSTLAPTTTLATESPFPKLDPKTPHRMPINLVRVHFFEEPETPSVPDNTETAIPSKLRITTDNPLPSDDLKTSHRMPINFIRVHFSEDPEQPLAPINTERVIPPKPRTTSDSPLPTDAPSEKHTTSLPTPKTTQSSKITRTKPVPHTTQIPPQPKTTQRSESPHTKAVSNETQTKKPHQPPPKKQKRPNQTPRPRTKPAPTGTPHVSIRPKIPHHALNATLAPYKVHPRPKTSIRPRTRPAQNGTQEAFRAKPTGDVNWMTDTIPGGRQPDSTKLLGVSRNISMEPNNTSKRTSLVSSPPLLPARPTSSRRRLQPNNVTGRPASSGSVLLARTPSTARPNGPSVSVRTPQKLPTSPSLGEDLVETTVFSPSPKSEVDVLGKTRYTAKHVTYMRKEDLVPCSITDSLRHFPVEEATNQEILNAPQNPPSNLTVVTVEGCSSFVILDWEQPDNDTVTEYEVISKENGAPAGKDKSIITTNQTYSTVENLKPDTSYEFQVIPKNPLGEGPSSNTVEFNTESADPRVSEPVKAGKDAIWTEIKFKPDSYSECKGKQYVKRTWYKKFVGIQLCNSLRYKIYLSDSLSGTFYNIGDQSGYGEDHCQFVDSFLDGRTGQHISPNQLTTRKGFYRSVRQQPVEFGDIGGNTHINYVHWYECGISIPGKW
ncbi:target of Nesh-SH3 [Spea bombifrons]|uniref:target of Nesh-SH3 n=1 Tax=Spea bombifrons TaxID=233779 RepID=UPI00234AF671|nr:target of Nesh-SH3 [Spea bombifrons]